MTDAPQPVRIPVDAGESVAGLVLRPERATALFALAHGAGADMRHAFMQAIAGALAERGIATLRFQFPYTEKRQRRIDPRPRLVATVRAAVAYAAALAPELPLLAGGKSMGGRMTSLAASEQALPGVRGIAFLGFPLHPAGKPSTLRAEHLGRARLPLLFVQGTRDTLAGLDLLRPIVAGLPLAQLQLVEDADHGFHVRKRSGRSDAHALGEIADAVRAFAERLARGES